MPADSPNISRIGQIAVNAHDLPRAIAFYRDTLGLRFLFEVPGMAFFDCGGVRLMLGVAEEKRFEHPASILYYAVDDIVLSFEQLVSRGAAVEHEPRLVATMPDHDLWLAFLRDTEENVFALMSEVPRP